MFIVISFPFSFHFHLHLTCRSLKKPRGSGACVWNIWIDVKLLLDLQQGGSARLTDTAQRRHCQFVVIQSLISSAYLHRVIISLNGNRPSQEPARRIFHKFHFLKRNSMCCYFIECTVAAICLTLTMETFRYTFSGPFINPFLSGITGVFLQVRCIPHQNSKRLFWASVCLS